MLIFFPKSGLVVLSDVGRVTDINFAVRKTFISFKNSQIDNQVTGRNVLQNC